MNKILLTLLLTISTSSFAGGWVNEITTGCALVGGANYLTIEGADSQELMVGCLVGGSIGYAMKEFFADEAAEDYQEKINILQTQLDEVLLQQNINNTLGVEGTPIQFRKRAIPTKRLKNGSWQLGTFAIEPYIPGQDKIIGD